MYSQSPVVLPEKSGDNALHQLLRTVDSDAQVESFIKEQKPEALLKMSTQVNHQGQIPLEILEHRADISDKYKQTIAGLLFPYTAIKHVKPLSELLDSDAILDAYPLDLARDIQRALFIACKVANEIRKINPVSDSHPDMNGLSEDEKDVISIKVEEMRKQFYIEKSIINQKYELLEKKCESETDKRVLENLKAKELSEKMAELVEKFKAGNCEELSTVLALKVYKEYKIPTTLEKLDGHMLVGVGDHVLCDVWMGEIYLRSEQAEKLHGYSSISILNGEDFARFIVLTPFDSRYQKLVTHLDVSNVLDTKPIQPTPEKRGETIQPKTPEVQASDLKFFKQNNKTKEKTGENNTPKKPPSPGCIVS